MVEEVSNRVYLPKNTETNFYNPVTGDVRPEALPGYLVAQLPLKYRTVCSSCLWFVAGRKLVGAGTNGDLVLWNGHTFAYEINKRVAENSRNKSGTSSFLPLTALAEASRHSLFVAGQEDGYVKYATHTLELVASFRAHSEAVRAVALSPNQTKFVSCSDDASIKVFDLVEGKCETTFEAEAGQRRQGPGKENEQKAHSWNATAVDWHSALALVASGSMDKTTRLWDPRERRRVGQLHFHKNRVSSVKLTRGFCLLSGSADYSAVLVDLRSQEKPLRVFSDNTKEVTCVAVASNDESVFAVGCADGAVVLYNTHRTGALKRVKFAHDYAVNSLAWNPTDELLVSSGKDYSVRVWGGSALGVFSPKHNFNELSLSEQVGFVKKHAGSQGRDLASVQKLKRWMLENRLDVLKPNVDVNALWDDTFARKLEDNEFKLIYGK